MANYYEQGSPSAPESPITRRKKMMADSSSSSSETTVDNTQDPLVPDEKAKKFMKGFSGVK